MTLSLRLQVVAIDHVPCITIPVTILLNYSIWKNNQMERRRFQQHELTDRHKNQGRTKGQTALTKFAAGPPPIEYSDLSISVRLSSAWWLAKEDVAIHKFASLVTSRLISHGLHPQSYLDDKAAWEMVGIIARHFRKLFRKRLSQSPFYGIMVDETTDRSTSTQLIIYIKYLSQDDDGNWTVAVDYLDLVTPKGQAAVDIKVCIL